MSSHMNLHARLLTEPITIEKQIQTPDEAGGYSLSWQMHSTCFARVKPIRVSHSQELLLGEQTQVRRLFRMVIRYTDINHTMRIRYQDLELAIISITPLDHNKGWLEIIAAEGGE